MVGVPRNPGSIRLLVSLLNVVRYENESEVNQEIGGPLGGNEYLLALSTAPSSLAGTKYL